MTVDTQPLHFNLVVNQRVLLFPVTWVHELFGNVLLSDFTVFALSKEQRILGATGGSILRATCLFLHLFQLGFELLDFLLLLLELLPSAFQVALAQVQARSLLGPLLLLLAQDSVQLVDLV